jgi:hypothetical protein
MLDVSNGPNDVDPFHLRMEIDPVSETLYSLGYQ